MFVILIQLVFNAKSVQNLIEMIDHEFTILVPIVSVLGKEHILPNYKLHIKFLDTFIIFYQNILLTNSEYY